jgi:hypothetical protein
MNNPGAIRKACETLEPAREATWRGRTGSETLPTGASYHLAVINTASSLYAHLGHHDPAWPFAVAEISRRNGTVKRIVKRYESLRAANSACDRKLRQFPTLRA